MKKSTKSIKRVLVLALALGFALVLASTNASAVTILLDPSGGGDSFVAIDHIVYQTDTGLSVGYNPLLSVPIPDNPYSVDFILQGRVGTASLSGNPVNIAPVPFDSQMTFTTRFAETVVSQGLNSIGNPIASFSAGEDTDSLFTMYINPALTANPDTAQGYTTGTQIFQGHMLALTSSFVATIPGTLGTGSFNVLVSVDSFDPNYIQFPAPAFWMQLVSTGTLNQPSTYNPTNMWDGTATAGNQMFKFDGSTDFEVVPEPGTLILLGLGLTGIALVSRRRK